MRKESFVWIVSHTIENETEFISLSNGEVLYYGGFWITMWRRLADDSKVIINFGSHGLKGYPEGTLVYKAGDSYQIVKLKQLADLTISDISQHEVSSDCDISCDFSYTSFNKGSINNICCSKHIIINILFNDGTRASVSASDDPVWLDAKVGMKVQHYTFKAINVYNLV